MMNMHQVSAFNDDKKIEKKKLVARQNDFSTTAEFSQEEK